jgi:hypothetical protein
MLHTRDTYHITVMVLSGNANINSLLPNVIAWIQSAALPKWLMRGLRCLDIPAWIVSYHQVMTMLCFCKIYL